MMKPYPGIGAIAAALIAFGACASENRELPATPAAHGGQIHDARPSSPDASNVHVDPEIAKKCKLPRAHFAFDSAEVNKGDSPALDKLAACFTTGPMRGRQMKIVGHADPRGELEYNFALGQRRAGSIADYLGKHGMSGNKISTSSRGELEASGTSEQGWASDRRVEVLLAD